MKRDTDYISPAFTATTSQYAPYNPSLAATASTSTASVWSDTSSQASDDTSLSGGSSDSESCDSYCLSKQTSCENVASFSRSLHHQAQAEALPAELRQNPRRTASGAHPRVCPPPLVRQSDRKVNFVDNLVDSSTQIVETIWPLSSAVCRSELGSKAVLPLRTFIQETLRRSRTSYSTLQVALYYLILIKAHVPKHNFTTEQPDDRHSDRALQCGRRMFLAALILASKYLQDRNYSARAWSKISGLNTQEINQNEIAFLLAVNWKLHIADDIFKRWTEIVLKNLPPASPPSPGGVCQQSADWKQTIMMLDPELTNIEGFMRIARVSSSPVKLSDLSSLSPRSILNAPQMGYDSGDLTPTPKPHPVILEPTPTSVYTPGRPAPTLGMLPTPRLTPQLSGFCTPAANAASQILGKSNAMGLAMNQVTSVCTNQYLDRVPMSTTLSPQGYCPVRRSSLANSISTASSPESMISDMSRSSRSSSISSASSLASATLNSKLSLPSRFRAVKPCNERVSLKPTVPSVPEDYDEHCFTSSPESYTGPVGKLGDLCLDTPLARRERKLEDMTRDPASDAARALQDLHKYHHASADTTSTARTGNKRSRPTSIDNSLQENVREMLGGRYSSETSWSDSLVRPRGAASESYLQVPVHSNFPGTSKRVCCSTEAANGFQAAAGRSGMSFRGPGMWDGILN